MTHDPRFVFIEDPNLSWTATGILIYLATRPKGWRAEENFFEAKTEYSPEPFTSALDELIAKGYLEIKTVVNADGNESGEWIVYFEPPKNTQGKEG